MKIIRKGTRRPDLPWMMRNWVCLDCGSVFFLEETDTKIPLEYRSDQRDGESIIMHCPVCERESTLIPESDI